MPGPVRFTACDVRDVVQVRRFRGGRRRALRPVGHRGEQRRRLAASGGGGGEPAFLRGDHRAQPARPFACLAGRPSASESVARMHREHRQYQRATTFAWHRRFTARRKRGCSALPPVWRRNGGRTYASNAIVVRHGRDGKCRADLWVAGSTDSHRCQPAAATPRPRCRCGPMLLCSLPRLWRRISAAPSWRSMAEGNGLAFWKSLRRRWLRSDARPSF